MHHISATLKMHFGSHVNSQMYSVGGGGGVLSVFARAIFQSIFLLAYEIISTLTIHFCFVPVCMCMFSFFAISMTFALCVMSPR